MPKIEIGSIHINYEVFGNGDHTVLCIPGFLGNVEDSFGDISKHMDRTKFRLVVMDPPGYGKSRPPSREWTMDCFQRDAEIAGELMEKIGYKKYSILGNSNGGEAGIILAGSSPSNVISLVTFGVAEKYDKNILDVLKVFTMVDSYPDEKLKYYERTYDRTYLKKMTEDFEKYGRLLNRSGYDPLMSSAESQLKCPVLITHCQTDRTVRVYQAENLAKKFHTAKIHVFPRGDHDFVETHPKEFLAVITPFLVCAFSRAQ